MRTLFLRLCGIVIVSALLLVPVILVIWGLTSLTGITGDSDEFSRRWIHFSIKLALLLATCLFAFMIDGMEIEDMGLRLKGRGSELGFGLVLGMGMVMSLFLFLYALGTYSIQGVNWSNAASFIIYALVLLFLGAAQEELLFRGYIINRMSSSMVKALLISSLLFAAIHLGHPGVSWLYFSWIVLSGFVFGYMYLWSGSLWLPFGFHFSWNLTMVLTFGVDIIEGSLLNLRFASGHWGLVLLGAIICDIIALYSTRWFLLRRGRKCPWNGNLTSFFTPSLILEDNTVEHG